SDCEDESCANKSCAICRCHKSFSHSHLRHTSPENLYLKGGGEGVVLRHFTTHRRITTCADKCRNRGSSPTVLRHRELVQQPAHQDCYLGLNLAARKSIIVTQVAD